MLETYMELVICSSL